MKKTCTVLSLVVLAGLMVLSQGCASILGQSKQSVNITSSPAGAKVEIYNGKGNLVTSGETPFTAVSLPAGAGFFTAEKYTVKFKKAGCLDCEAPINVGVNGWYIGGNFLLGGLVGWLIIDPLTGAMWTLKDVNRSLESGPSAQILQEPLQVTTLDQVPSSLQTRLVRIN